MRWAYEGVVFEPSGVDHQSPGSSFVVGGRLVSEIFGGQQPIGPMYAFVGISGMAKMSSSRGGVPTPADALDIMEEPVLRWLYCRRRPQQSFTVAFDAEIHRLYDEWDAVVRKVADGTASGPDAVSYDRAVRTAAGELPRTPASAAVPDAGLGRRHHHRRRRCRRCASSATSTPTGRSPRWTTSGRGWIERRTGQRHSCRRISAPCWPTSRTRAPLESLSAGEREALDLLLAGLDAQWSLDGLSQLVYAVPKLQAGLAADAPPTPELRVAQRAVLRACLPAPHRPRYRTAAADAAARRRAGAHPQAPGRLIGGPGSQGFRQRALAPLSAPTRRLPTS